MDPFALRGQSPNQRQEMSGECGSKPPFKASYRTSFPWLPINDDFPEESLMLVEVAAWYAHIANYLVIGEVPNEWKT